MRGNKPQPNLHVVVPNDGSPTARRARHPAPARRGVVSEPHWHTILGYDWRDPPKIGRDARRIWRKMHRELQVVDRLAVIDEDLLEEYALCRARILECENELQEHGLMLNGPRGPIKNPCATIAGQYRSRVKVLEEQLGIGFMNRLRMPPPTPPDDTDSDLDDDAD